MRKIVMTVTTAAMMLLAAPVASADVQVDANALGTPISLPAPLPTLNFIGSIVVKTLLGAPGELP